MTNLKPWSVKLYEDDSQRIDAVLNNLVDTQVYPTKGEALASFIELMEFQVGTERSPETAQQLAAVRNATDSINLAMIALSKDMKVIEDNAANKANLKLSRISEDLDKAKKELEANRLEYEKQMRLEEDKYSKLQAELGSELALKQNECVELKNRCNELSKRCDELTRRCNAAEAENGDYNTLIDMIKELKREAPNTAVSVLND